jgi:diguanylate cyclase (GGDEF)-like protein/putative nucleotidyltransferase with HDIG domain
VSAVPTDIELNDSSRPSAAAGLPGPALVYYVIVVGAAVAAASPFLGRLSSPTHGWITFAVLSICTAVAQLFVVVTPRRGQKSEGTLSYHTTGVFLLPAALLLAPQLAALVAIVQHVPEWLKKRQPWYIGTFNIANYTLTILAALGTNHFILQQKDFITNHNARFAIAGLAACFVFVFVNHALLTQMFHLAKGHSYSEIGLFSVESLLPELVLAGLGVGVATFWHSNPWLIPIALAPLILIHRSLSVPALQLEARVDGKTGLFNARHFASALAEELARAQRFDRPLSLMMADLDLLRDINNNYGHLAGDAVLKGVADVFRQQLRHYDIPARFGGEEFSVLLPETPPEQAIEIAERIRAAVAASRFEVETSSEPIRATISIGIAGYPQDGIGANELIHQADLAVYRAKLQGRNRVLGVSTEPLMIAEAEIPSRLTAVPEDEAPPMMAAPISISAPTEPPARAGDGPERRAANPRPHSIQGPRFFELSFRVGALVAFVSTLGVVAGVIGLILGSNTDLTGLLLVIALVGGGQALALELDDGSVSVSAVGALAGAALYGPRAGLVLAITAAAVHWSAERISLHHVLYNMGALTLASLAAAGVFAVAGTHEFAIAAAGLVAGAIYFGVNMGLISLAMAVEGRESWWSVFKERFAWLLPHYVVYGFIGGVMAIAYHAAGLYALAVFTVPLLLMRKTQESYLSHTRRSAHKLREAAETIQSQNVSLEQANRLLKERSTAAMESLSATVDARDSYTAGHSRRVQQLALAIGRELGLSQAELDLLGHAALFHDIGKLAIPDSILLKPASLTASEWALMQSHADEGARIIDRLGFLGDAVPSIRHHHERFDGTGYPERLEGEDIPLGARIIHVADALDSMLTTRIYRAARPASEALDELRRAAGSQFCPRCVTALERVLAVDTTITGNDPPREPQRAGTAELAAAS